jgi:hypothetical protein
VHMTPHKIIPYRQLRNWCKERFHVIPLKDTIFWKGPAILPVPWPVVSIPICHSPEGQELYISLVEVLWRTGYFTEIWMNTIFGNGKKDVLDKRWKSTVSREEFDKAQSIQRWW